jgi:glycine oxidase
LDGLPYLGKLPGLEDAYVAAGHFRSGLYLSAATAVVMSQLMRGEEPEIDLTPFRVGR